MKYSVILVLVNKNSCFAVEYNLASPYIGIIFNHVFYPPEYVAAFANAVMLMAPIIVIESLAGGYMGYKVYQRTKKVQIGII